MNTSRGLCVEGIFCEGFKHEKPGDPYARVNQNANNAQVQFQIKQIPITRYNITRDLTESKKKKRKRKNAYAKHLENSTMCCYIHSLNRMLAATWVFRREILILLRFSEHRINWREKCSIQNIFLAIDKKYPVCFTLVNNFKHPTFQVSVMWRTARFTAFLVDLFPTVALPPEGGEWTKTFTKQSTKIAVPIRKSKRKKFTFSNNGRYWIRSVRYSMWQVEKRKNIKIINIYKTIGLR